MSAAEYAESRSASRNRSRRGSKTFSPLVVQPMTVNFASLIVTGFPRPPRGSIKTSLFSIALRSEVCDSTDRVWISSMTRTCCCSVIPTKTPFMSPAVRKV